MSQILKPIQQGHFKVDFVFFFHSILNILLFYFLLLRSIEEGTQLQNSSLEVNRNEALRKSEHLIHTLLFIFPKTARVCIYVYT